MKERFRFRLERLLDVRRAQERVAVRELDRARREMMESRERLDALILQERREVDQCRRWLGGAVEAARLRLAERYLDSLRRRISSARTGHRDLEALAERWRIHRTEAAARVRVLERLRERRRNEWRVETERRERRALDEAAARRAGRP
ncbi:MAG: flagellar export protein FliJ [Planctomycetes bacterium]|nr:flagellar export protein FliJ [Planctomycetota bacterium]